MKIAPQQYHWWEETLLSSSSADEIQHFEDFGVVIHLYILLILAEEKSRKPVSKK